MTIHPSSHGVALACALLLLLLPALSKASAAAEITDVNVSVADGCQSNTDCSLAGTCDAASRTCRCISGFTGPACEALNMRALARRSIPLPIPAQDVTTVSGTPDMGHEAGCCGRCSSPPTAPHPHSLSSALFCGLVDTPLLLIVSLLRTSFFPAARPILPFVPAWGSDLSFSGFALTSFPCITTFPFALALPAPRVARAGVGWSSSAGQRRALALVRQCHQWQLLAGHLEHEQPGRPRCGGEPCWPIFPRIYCQTPLRHPPPVPSLLVSLASPLPQLPSTTWHPDSSNTPFPVAHVERSGGSDVRGIQTSSMPNSAVLKASRRWRLTTALFKCQAHTLLGPN